MQMLIVGMVNPVIDLGIISLYECFYRAGQLVKLPAYLNKYREMIRMRVKDLKDYLDQFDDDELVYTRSFSGRVVNEIAWPVNDGRNVKPVIVLGHKVMNGDAVIYNDAEVKYKWD